MPVNRNALIRYKTIDKCLSNPYRKWTLNDLIEACSDALYEYEGIDKGVSRRTVQADIQIMRSDKLGYNAPIENYENKYYRYSDSAYSITNLPLSHQDLDTLSEVLGILNQFKSFSHFDDLNTMVQKLEDKVNSAKNNVVPIIDLEKNENLKGLKFLEPVYRAIQNQKVLKISYQSFKARAASEIIFHPYLLKEYRNRWFILGCRDDESRLMNLALDRIHTIFYCDELTFMPAPVDNVCNYYNDVIGVTVNYGRPCKVKIWVDKGNAPYVLTKPLHHSQELIETRDDGSIIIQINVIHNFELEREILGFGRYMKVISPESLKNRIDDHFRKALANEIV